MLVTTVHAHGVARLHTAGALPLMQVPLPHVGRHVLHKPVRVLTVPWMALTQTKAVQHVVVCLGVGLLPVALAERHTSQAVLLVVTAV